ncbi:MAG TPA: amidophosphoribosyltransferase, partial [Actinobacteria bacterium]|nr:amidophosphoribosyltransferase [Actinomycetota bacterium]
RPGEACGVFGVFAPGLDAARLTYFGLFALQHRGQESAGIAVSDGTTLTVYRDLGLVAQVFDEATLAGLRGGLAIGHTRYSTTGSNRWENSQPVYRNVGDEALALAHNGNLTNTAALAERLGPVPATTDSELMAEAVAAAMRDGLELPEALERVAGSFEGAFTLTLMDRHRLVGLRDPHGFRPLCLGRLSDGWVLASETAALDIVGASFVREVAPGEMIVVDEDGPRSRRPFEEAAPRLCLFEFVYFARPDSTLYGQTVHAARQRMGRALAEQAPADADLVVPVPESGIPAAQGYAAASGIPYSDGLVKNRYVGRTFIEPAQTMRDRGIRMKLNPIPEILAGRRIVLVDDSIVRGSTTRRLVDLLRAAGAAEVHLRISSPPYRWPCHYGMDTGDRATLIAADRTVDEVRELLGADSLAYLDLGRLVEATGVPDAGFCTACLSGTYPTPVPAADGKFVLEGSR